MYLGVMRINTMQELMGVIGGEWSKSEEYDV